MKKVRFNLSQQVEKSLPVRNLYVFLPIFKQTNWLYTQQEIIFGQAKLE